MSAQTRDELIIDGESYYMSTFPMEKWLNERNIKIPITFTSNQKGYVATWEIDQGALWLKEFTDNRCLVFIGETIVEDIIIDESRGYTFERLFDGKQKVMADWFTGTLEIVYGDALYYKYSGYAQVYAFERLIQIEKGKVLSEKIYDNRPFTQTQKEMRKKYDPYYWAAFVLVE